jgi:tagatose-1,6-bisphosphate aldolase non-catalytic subunit AgaZ/GatZ
MSRNGIDATIRMAYRWQRQVMLVASRAQIECEEFGGGYVERWSTEQFIRYVRDRDPVGLIKICRDHGGPWQHPDETTLKQEEVDVLARSLVSLRADIRSGMDLLHLDTSREGHDAAEFDSALKRLVEFYGDCQEYAQSIDRRVAFEVGVERQRDEADDPEEFRGKLEQILGALAYAGLQPPTFVVAQTGTRVVGTRNCGALVSQRQAVAETVSKVARVCREHGMALKAHNVDYLAGEAVTELFRNGTDAINVAPEFGVLETRTFLALLDELALPKQRDEFLRLAYESGAWHKWMDGDSTDLERSVVAGHYIFATDEFRDVKARAENACRSRGTTVDGVLSEALDQGVERYAVLAWGGGLGAGSWT